MERAVAWKLVHGLVGLELASVPDLRVHSSRQPYEFVKRDGERRIVRYGGGERGPSYEIVFDGDGLVIDYPGLARRVAG